MTECRDQWRTGVFLVILRENIGSSEICLCRFAIVVLHGLRFFITPRTCAGHLIMIEADHPVNRIANILMRLVVLTYECASPFG